MSRRYVVVDVFSAEVTRGNPVAVVLDAAGLDTPTMQHIARWTNLSETTFVLPPTDARAHYRVRIFTPGLELPFAGHPTLGTSHAVVEAGIVGAHEAQLVQECAAGLVTVVRSESSVGADYRFRLPPARLVEVTDANVAELAAALGTPIDMDAVPTLVDVGPVWLVARLPSLTALLALAPDLGRLAALERALGATGTSVFAPRPEGGIEVRSFVPLSGIAEDPVCGSGNGSIAAFLRERGLLPAGQVEYLARQGRCLGRDGQVRVALEPDGDIWVGGACITAVRATLHL